jgi:hypothetical protein
MSPNARDMGHPRVRSEPILTQIYSLGPGSGRIVLINGRRLPMIYCDVRRPESSPVPRIEENP